MKSALCFVAANLVFMAPIVDAQEAANPPAKANAETARADARAAENPDAKAQIETLRASCEAAKAVVATDREKWQAALRTWYAQELTKLLANQVKLGDLEGAVAAKAERERITASAEPTPAEIDAMPESLRKLRASYDAGLKRITDEAARRNEAASRKLLADLEALQKQFTISVRLDDALAVRIEKDRIAAEMPKIPAAAERPAETSAPASGKPDEPGKSAPPDDTADGTRALRAAIENTEWTWERDVVKAWIRFGKDGAMKHRAFDGTWEAINSHEVRIKAAWGESMLRFNDARTAYRATSGEPQKQGVKGTKK